MRQAEGIFIQMRFCLHNFLPEMMLLNATGVLDFLFYSKKPPGKLCSITNKIKPVQFQTESLPKIVSSNHFQKKIYNFGIFSQSLPGKIFNRQFLISTKLVEKTI